MNEQEQIFQSMYPIIKSLFKYYHLKSKKKINMNIFQNHMNTNCQELMRLCTFYEEVQHKGPQWELVLKEYQNYNKQKYYHH